MPESLTSTWFWSQFLSTLLLPPAGFLLLALFAILLVSRRSSSVCGALVLLSGIGLWASSMPIVGRALIGVVSPVMAFDPERLKYYDFQDRPQAIVVLGGGRALGAVEYGGEDLKPLSLARVRYAARLARATNLPVAVVGGKPEGGSWSEAALMKAALETDFRVPVRWTESASRTTSENARYTATILQADRIRRVLIVTDVVHAARARIAFEHAGLQVMLAPTGFARSDPRDPKQWLPTAEGLASTRAALHEAAGQLVYRWFDR